MRIQGKDAERLAKKLCLAGALALLATVVWTAWLSWGRDGSAPCDKPPVVTAAAAPTQAEVAAAAAAEAAATKNDGTGILRIVAVWPEKVQFSDRICVSVAGVVSSETQAKSSAAVDVALYLNNRRSPLVSKARSISAAQTLTFELNPPADASSATAVYWRDVLGGQVRRGVANLSVGLSRSNTSNPEVVADKPIQFTVYLLPILALGSFAIALLVGGFVVFAANSTVLRDTALTIAETQKFKDAETAATSAAAALKNDPTNDTLKNSSTRANEEYARLQSIASTPVGTYSLGRTQMAVWLVLATAGFIFLWLTMGLYLHVITAAILVLLGINGATGLAAVFLNDKNAPPKESKSFLLDLISDGDGPKLQRIQVVVWTCILGVIFIWNTIWNFIFVDFDTNLLLLMGLANAMYLGFKPAEKA